MLLTVTSGFLLGLLGSMHCIGMCGPLALSLPAPGSTAVNRFFSLFSYQLGRVVTYGTLGFVLGIAGRQLHLAGLQQAFSIIAGVLVLAGVFTYFSHIKKMQLPFLNQFYVKIQLWIIHLLKSPKNAGTFFLLGLANGLLPCGMVYIAIAGAVSTGSLAGSAVFMMAFGAGTIPAMMMVSYLAYLVKPDIRKSLQKLVPVTMALMGIILLLRGMNLGIPYISPLLPSAPGETIHCH